MKLNKKKIILSAIFITSISIVGVSFADAPGAPCQDHTLLGFGWSENVGAISFSCRNTQIAGTGSDYGVDIAADGKLSGHAWNEGIGYISFDRSETKTPPSNDPCSDDSCTAQLQGDKIVGWARAISACNWNGTKCTNSGAGSNAGGWDGWIRFDLSNPSDAVKIGVQINNPSDPYNGKYPLTGWAFSGKDTATERGVIGSISMNNANTGGPVAYKVVSSIGPIIPNNIPIADFACDNSTCRCGFDFSGLLIPCNVAPVSSCTCYDEDNSYLAFKNLSTDPDGLSDIEWSHWYEAGPGLSSPFPSSWTRELPGISQYSMDKSQGDYKLKLIVVDKKGAESLPKDVNIEFLRGLKVDFSCSEDGVDWSVSCSNISVEEGKTVWFKDISTPSESSSHVNGLINSRAWKHKDGTVFGNGESTATTTASMNTSEITLAVVDTNNHKGEKMQSLKVIPLPRWKELPPFK